MKKYTMDDFINKKIAVKVTPDNVGSFLKMCEKRGLLWSGGEKATEYLPQHAATYIVCGYPDKRKNSLACGNGFLGSRLLEIYDFKQIDFADIITENRYQILIDCDGDTTTAKMIINGKEVKTAQAKRNPADKFNWKLAASLGFDRLFSEKKVKEVKRPAFAGEYIKIIGEAFSFSKIGDIMRVNAVAPSGNPYVLEKDHPRNVPEPICSLGWCYPKHSFVVLEGYKPIK